MSLDISQILGDWPYEPAQISARRIVGDDGKDKIQLRLDLGLLQMAVTGNPAGLRPHGYESLLAYYEDLLHHRVQEDGSGEHFSLDMQACQLLRSEGVMYYHRYLAEFILEDYAAAERDTVRNLHLMDFCGKYAADESDRSILEQHRPYVIMMRTRASALLALRDEKPRAALDTVREGAAQIRQCYSECGAGEASEGGELHILRTLARKLQQLMPQDPIRALKRLLAAAVREERYEDAAGIRDQLREMSSDTAARRPV